MWWIEEAMTLLCLEKLEGEWKKVSRLLQSQVLGS